VEKPARYTPLLMQRYTCKAGFEQAEQQQQKQLGDDKHHQVWRRDRAWQLLLLSSSTLCGPQHPLQEGVCL
jgi:hypothetical protein